MSLDTLNENEPGGFRSVDKGAGEIRLTRSDSKSSVAVQHWLSGEHRFPSPDVVAPTVGQLALKDGRLLYGTGSSWKTSSFLAESGVGGRGAIVNTTTNSEMIGYNMGRAYTTFMFFCTGTFIGHKPTGDTSCGMYISLWAPYSTRALVNEVYYAPKGAAGAPPTGKTFTQVMPLNTIGYAGIPIAAGVRVSLMVRLEKAGNSCEMLSDICMTFVSA